MDVGFCNAVRRLILADTSTSAHNPRCADARGVPSRAAAKRMQQSKLRKVSRVVPRKRIPPARYSGATQWQACGRRATRRPNRPNRDHAAPR